MAQIENTRMQNLYPILMFILMTLMVFGLSQSDKPTPALGADAPEARFSSARAFSDLSDLLKENVPHPVGSEANRVIRDRIVAKLNNRGFDVEIQEDFTCQADWATCANTENIIAIKKGTESGGGIVLMSHYDSVPAGAAATDDGYGVAVALETARALQHNPAFKNDIILLITDAEEVGLNGAEAFAAHHPAIDNVDIIINIESRGTSGQSAMFETGADNNMLMDVYRSAISRPFANSLTYEVYKRMPNDTDYTVFRKRNIPGLNFASTGSASRYHSVLDDLEHVDKATLQQHGNNAFAMIQAFGNMDLSKLETREGEATYFDVYTLFLVKWPSSWNVPLSLIGLLAIAAALIIQVKSGQVKPMRLLWAFGGILLTIVAIVVTAAILGFPLGSWQTLHPLDHPNPWPGKSSVLLSGLLAVISTLYLLRNKLEARTLILVGWTLNGIASIALSYVITGASYLALAPLIVFVLVSAYDAWRANWKVSDIDFLFASHAGFFVAFYIGAYHFHLLDLVFSFDMSAAKIATLALAVIALTPLGFAYYQTQAGNFKRHAQILGALALITGIWSMLIPGFTKDKPDPLNVVYMQDETTGEAFLTLEHLLWGEDTPSPYFEQLGIEGEQFEFPLPTWIGRTWTKQATESLSLTPPKLDIVYDETTEDVREIEAEISAGHGGYSIVLMFSEGTPLQSLTIKGEQPIGDLANWSRRVAIRLSGTQRDTFRIRMELDSAAEFSLTLAEQAQLVKNDAINALLAKRPEHANSTQNGDRTIVLKRFDF